MRKLLPIFVIIIILATGAAYYSVWNKKADALNAKVESFIAGVNKNKQYITHEGISTGGFPNDIHISIKNITVNLPMSELLSALGATPNKTGFDFAGIKPGWVEHMKHTGEVVISSSLMSDKYAISIMGDMNTKSTLPDGMAIESTSKINDKMACNMQLHSGSAFGTLTENITAADSPEAMLELFKSFECAHQGFAITRVGSNTPYYSSGPMRLFFSLDRAEANSNFQFILKGSDLLATKEADSLMQHYFDALGEANQIHINRRVNLSVYGKQTIDVDVLGAFPRDMASASNIMFKINSMSFASDIVKMSATADVNIQRSNEATQMSIGLQTNMNATPQYDVLMRDSLQGVAESLLTSHELRGQHFTETLSSLDEQQRTALITDISPQYSQLGDIKSDIRLAYSAAGDMQKNPMAPGRLTLDAFNFTTTPYGLKTSGALEMKSALRPVGKVTLQLINANALVDDVVSYAYRLRDAIKPFDEALAASFDIPQNLVQGIKHFLYELSETKEATYTYNFISQEDGNMTISGKPIMEVMQLYMHDIAGQMKPQPSAQQPEEETEE